MRRVGALCVFALVSFMVRPARALELDDFIHVDSEGALYDLYEQGLLDEAQYDALLELRAAPVVLDDASAEELYRLPNLRLDEAEAIVAHREGGGDASTPAALAAAGLLSEEQAEALRFFVAAPAPAMRPRRGRARGAPVRASLRLRGQALVRGGPPLAFAAARLHALDGLDLGATVTLRHQGLGQVGYDAERGALVAAPPATRLAAPRYHLRYRRGYVDVLAGTYRVGFAEGLVLDLTGLRSPDGARVDAAIRRDDAPGRPCRVSVAEQGVPCDDASAQRFVTPDLRARGGLRGLYLAARALPLGGVTVSAHAFGSFATHDVYQYSVYDAARCPDPRIDDAACAAPPVYVATSGGASSARYLYASLPRLLDVGLVGGRVSLDGGSARVGVTGYGAATRYRVQGVQLDTRPSGGLPFGGPFGALGVDGRLRLGALALGAELARSFDATPSGGGFGALLRGTLALDHGELELGARYYGPDFANPYFGAVAAADAVDGFRARDELGGQLRYAGRLRGGRVAVRVLADTHLRPSLGLVAGSMSTRLDLRLIPSLRVGGALGLADRDLRRLGRGGCYEGEGPSQGGVSVPCGGARFSGGVRLRYAPTERLSAQLMHDQALYDVTGERMRHSLASALALSAAPLDALRIRVRVRHALADLAAPAASEHSLRAYLEAAARLPRGFALRLRYTLFVWLDRRPSTLARTPSPAHVLSLDVEASR